MKLKQKIAQIVQNTKSNLRIIIAFVLTMTISITTIGLDASAKDNSVTCSETVFIDGQKFYVVTDVHNKTVTVNSASSSDDSKLVILPNGDGLAKVYDQECDKYVDYKLDISNFTEDNIDIDVLDETGTIVEEINDIDDLIDDKYEGQAATVSIIVGITLETLITAVLQAAACISIAGVLYYAGKAVAAEVSRTKETKKYYYNAYIYKKNVFVDLSHRISKNKAVAIIKTGGKNANIYTYTKKLAKSVTLDAGLGIEGPEISCFKGKKVKFYHYHTANRNGAHVFYGFPVIES